MEFLDHDEHHNMVSHPENSKEFAGLAVNSGVAEPPKVNPYFHPRKRRRTMTAGEYVEGILKGDVTVLSRAVTLVESLVPEHQALAQEVIEKCLPSAGSLGGVARKTRESIVLCEAAGFNNIFVETVGVGQSETAVHSMVDFFLLIQLAGTGDELQGIKRGIMEMADGIVINKADGDNIERANLAKAQFQSALHLFPPTLSGWIPEVLTYSGYYGIGIKEVWEMIDRYFEFVKGNGYFEHRRMEQEKYWMYETIDEQLKAHFYRDPEVEALLKVKQDNVLAARQSSFVAAKDVLDYYFQKMGLK